MRFKKRKNFAFLSVSFVFNEECERIIKEKINKGHKPKAFVFENARGIMSCKIEDGRTVPEEIKRRMKQLGYSLSTKLILD